MKRFLQTKGATYLNGASRTIAIRKDCIEFYTKLSGTWHAVVNIEYYKDAIRLIVCLGDFAGPLFDKVMMEGISHDDNPLLAELITSGKYKILNDRTGDEPETHIFRDIEKEILGMFDILADKEVMEALKEMTTYFINLHNELKNSPSPTIQPLYLTFY